MAGEQEVLEALFESLRRRDAEQIQRRIVASWAADGLPIDVANGLVGRLQLEHAVGVLRQLSVEVASAAQLPLIFERNVNFWDASDQSPENPLSSLDPQAVRVADVPTLNETAEALNEAAERIVEFLEDHDDRG